MNIDIKEFTQYLSDVKHASKNTQICYQRDLIQMSAFLEQKGIADVGKVTKTVLNSYILYLEKEGKATTTVSRVLASMKAFFHYEFSMGRIKKDPAELLKAPKIEKKAPEILSVEEVNNLLNQPSADSPKEIRDKAMLELLYATGIRVSELINLKLTDINLSIGFITCQDGHKERTIPFGRSAKQAVLCYVEQARTTLLRGLESEFLFTNCNGTMMSRQGFWKIIKYYGEKAGIQSDITPHMIRHSFAVHLLNGGADIHAVQAMMGYSDMTTTQMYTTYAQSVDPVRKAYAQAHPRR
ncbi:MAG: tyrosine recombinase [Hungatella sp.]